MPGCFPYLCPLVPGRAAAVVHVAVPVAQHFGCQQGYAPLPALPLQRARPAPLSSTASSLRHRQLCSTTWTSSSRGWCGRSACAKGAKSPTRTLRLARSTRRASPAEPATSSTGWWPGTAAKWPSKSVPSPAMTCLCSESHSPVPPHVPAGSLLSASSVAKWLCGEFRQGWSDAEDVELFLLVLRDAKGLWIRPLPSRRGDKWDQVHGVEDGMGTCTWGGESLDHSCSCRARGEW